MDERFRILNGHYFGKFNTLVFHCSPPFGNGYNGLSDDEVVEEAEDGEQDRDEGEEGWNPLQSLWEEADSLSQLVREEVSTAWEQLWR